nr:hypothetical protein CFP56_03318 [Quercus suber]
MEGKDGDVETGGRKKKKQMMRRQKFTYHRNAGGGRQAGYVYPMACLRLLANQEPGRASSSNFDRARNSRVAALGRVRAEDVMTMTNPCLNPLQCRTEALHAGVVLMFLAGGCLAGTIPVPRDLVSAADPSISCQAPPLYTAFAGVWIVIILDHLHHSMRASYALLRLSHTVSRLSYSRVVLPRLDDIGFVTARHGGEDATREQYRPSRSRKFFLSTRIFIQDTVATKLLHSGVGRRAYRLEPSRRKSMANRIRRVTSRLAMVAPELKYSSHHRPGFVWHGRSNVLLKCTSLAKASGRSCQNQSSEAILSRADFHHHGHFD